jgi:hypothetical protein
MGFPPSATELSRPTNSSFPAQGKPLASSLRAFRNGNFTEWVSRKRFLMLRDKIPCR